MAYAAFKKVYSKYKYRSSIISTTPLVRRPDGGTVMLPVLFTSDQETCLKPGGSVQPSPPTSIPSFPTGSSAGTSGFLKLCLTSSSVSCFFASLIFSTIGGNPSCGGVLLSGVLSTSVCGVLVLSIAFQFYYDCVIDTAKEMPEKKVSFQWNFLAFVGVTHQSSHPYPAVIASYLTNNE
jgi:hypothetical protein